MKRGNNFGSNHIKINNIIKCIFIIFLQKCKIKVNLILDSSPEEEIYPIVKHEGIPNDSYLQGNRPFIFIGVLKVMKIFS